MTKPELTTVHRSELIIIYDGLHIANASALAEYVIAKANDYYDWIIGEVDINLYMKGHFGGMKTFVAKYERCYVDSKLNLNIVMQKLGPTLKTVRGSCTSAIGGASLEDKVMRNLNLLFVLTQMNDRFISFCDIKLENIMLCLDYNPQEAFFTDFGVAEIGAPCQGGTPFYYAPERLYRN